MDNTKTKIKRRNLPKKWRGVWIKGTNKPKEYKETTVICSDTYRGLSHSEENKYM